MPRIMRFGLIALIPITLALIVSAYILNTAGALDTDEFKNLPDEKKGAYWEGRIHKVGEDRAYKEYKTLTTVLPPVQQHWELHVFGNALYTTGGLEAIKTCDATHDYACYHAFMISDIQEFGTGAARRLHGVCVDLFGQSAFSCLHGLGHALVASLGYDEESLSKALDVCDENPDPNPSMLLYGCLNGAFMEFNTPMTISGYEPRSFSDAEAFEPCNSITDRSRKIACTYTQLYWWFSSLKHEDPSTRLTHVGNLCRSMNTHDPELYRICIQGAGNAMDSTIDYEPTKAADACSHIDSEPTMQALCQKFAAFRFTRYFPLEKALLACDGGSNTSSLECRDTVRTLTKTYYEQKDS